MKIVVHVTERESFGPQKCSTGVVVKGLALEEFVVEIDACGVVDD